MDTVTESDMAIAMALVGLTYYPSSSALLSLQASTLGIVSRVRADGRHRNCAQQYDHGAAS